MNCGRLGLGQWHWILSLAILRDSLFVIMSLGTIKGHESEEKPSNGHPLIEIRGLIASTPFL